ncbi:MAG: hypothetical protein KJO75_23800 [Dactylosporangium sp.]|nr:hypothetical protein [Dactylosporangium sp.]
MWWILAALAVAVLLGMHLTWSASRVDRLHARASAASATLDAKLVRRAVAAATLAEATQLPPLMYAARVALDVPVADREAAENDLTRQLRAVVVPDDPTFATVIAANRRVALARQVHTDVARDALRARRRFTVRVFGLARKHPAPMYFDIDDPTLSTAVSRAEPHA